MKGGSVCVGNAGGTLPPLWSDRFKPHKPFLEVLREMEDLEDEKN